jgi:hypothetical protein
MHDAAPVVGGNEGAALPFLRGANQADRASLASALWRREWLP